MLAQQLDIAEGVCLERPDDRLAWYAAVARFAPSKHNTQPWRFVVAQDALEVWHDRSRRLAATDPHGRELVLSCGAAVQAAVVAARAIGVRLQVDAWPEGEAGPVARLTEAGKAVRAPDDQARLSAMVDRRTDRGPLDASALPASLPFVLRDVVTELGGVLRLVSGEGERLTLARLVELADRQLARLPEVAAELAAWVRPPEDPRRDGVPATSSRGAQASYSAPFVQRDFSAEGASSRHDRPGQDAPLVAVLCTAQDRKEDWLQAGRALMALLLATTMAGGNASYLNQPLELQGTRDLLRTELDLEGHPQVILRIGAGAAVAAPPRRTVGEVVERPG